MDSKIKTKFNILAIFAIIIFCFAISPITLQNDTFYTIKIGEHILENGIDMQDPFSWHDNLPYTYPHWIYDVLIYLVFSVGGYLGIYLSTVILACILGITLYLTCTKLVKNNLVSFILTIGALYLLTDFIAARAQLITFILFALTIFFIEMFLETKNKWYLLPLIIIPIIIANVHLAVWPFYFILFLPYIAEYIIYLIIDSNFITKISIIIKKRKVKKLSKAQSKEEKLEKLEQNIKSKIEKLIEIKEKREKRRLNSYKIIINKNSAAKWLIIIFILALFTGLLTPLGSTPYTYLINTLEGNTTKSISEHLPLTLINSKEYICVLIIFIALLMFTDTKIRLSDLFMLGGLILLSFITRRQMSMVYIICLYILARICTTFLNKYDPKGSETVIKFLTTILGKVLVISFIAVVGLYLFRPKMDNKFINTASYPVEATKYIKENIDIGNMKLYNEYNYGSYLLLNDIPVFIDSRADLYAPEFNKGKDIFSDFINISNINLYYEDKFEEYSITHVIVFKKAKLNLFLSRDNNYKQLYSDANFVLYERNIDN